MVVDDDPFVQSALKLLLDHSECVELAGSASTGSEAVSTFRDIGADVILMDLQMPQMGGIAATEAICKSGLSPAPRIVVLTSYADDSDVMEALRAGASGFLLKDTDPAGIVNAIRTVHGGEALLSPAVTTQLIREYKNATMGGERPSKPTPELDSMTPREADVARAVAEGKSNSDIASELFMSVSTVKTTVSRVMTKLRVVNRVQLALSFHGIGPGEVRD